MTLALGIGLQSRSRALHSFLASSLVNTSTGLVVLPGWLTISCATTGRTTQRSAATLIAGLGANAARARNAGLGEGLSVEMARSNFCLQSNDLNTTWTKEAGTVVATNAIAGPDGAVTADQVDVHACAAGAGIYMVGTAPTSTRLVHSLWGLQSGGAAAMKLSDSEMGTVNVTITLGASWGRFDGTIATSSGAGDGPWLQKLSSGGGTSIGYFAYGQTEAGKYPSSAFPATTTTAARAADVLSIATPTNFSANGFFATQFVIAPNYANSETAADHDWIFNGAGNRLYFRQSDQKVVMHFGGATDIVSSALTFARDTALRVTAEYRRGYRRLQIVNDATGTSLYDSGSQSAGSSIAFSGAINLLGNASGAQESADLRRLFIYRA